MSYYTEQISTKVIDANVYVQNLRAEFQIPQGDYGNRWRLMDVGLTTAGAGVVYNRIAGGWSIIKNIRLLNGRDELDSCREVNRYLAFKSFNRKNADNKSKTSKYNYSAKGMGTDGGTVGNVLRTANIHIDLSVASRELTNDPATTPACYLDLRECLPMLKSMEIFPAEMFPQLRLIIEFETDLKAMVNNTTTACNTIRPILSVDVMEDEGLVNSMKAEVDGSSWDCVEHDLFRIAPPDAPTLAGVVQQTNARLNGFNNKRLMRMAMCKVAVDKRNYVSGAGVVVEGGTLSSDAFINEKLQVRVNNKPKLPRNGANGRNQRLAILTDSHGDSSCYYGSNMVSANKFIERTGGARSGGQDYYGLKVNEIIKDLQVSLDRNVYATNKGVNDLQPERGASGYEVHCFGEVRKQIVVKGNSYQIIYA